ncbi:alanyl-tRNA synthetase [Acetoanaerobium pronyense]|uniref:Alanine--tRNA ligase n=1 Tax=Acetoanaerobium pronyense TaxID=1482736 RepID=A0ABS4KJ18_9FIRM|nr:alanine--tRNA ligase [Acetoanaerobium pronyense]MBP2027798.1 alanyl-tRNA synthetase [Acetoanaerobium pronyense]
MDYMKVSEIRKKFLDYFKSKEHFVDKSYSLVPENDKSLLLINAGMAPLKNYFMGIETPPSKRMATCQKCMRTGDIENVGKTARHATFFEMLGNFSFGDYFKKEAIEWAWEFTTKELGLNEEELWVTVYEEDDEAFEIWENHIKVPKEKIVRLGKDDNFWEIGTGTGPCGPCSEIYIDRGKGFGCDDPNCKPGCDCDRFLEFWNLVFTQFDKDESGNYNLLPNPNIDTGMGLERIACIMQGVESIFDIDTMKNLINKVAQMSNQEYGKDNKKDISMRVIADHARAVTFLISDGVIPSNEGRGYVIRRLIRRAIRHGKLLGMEDMFLWKLVDTVVENYKDAYEELTEKQEYIEKILKIEEEKFEETLDQGITILNGYIERYKNENKMILNGDEAFKLYDTYGFPLELTLEILIENGMTVDEEGFKNAMKSQRERARAARNEKGVEGWKNDMSGLELSVQTTIFNGYDTLYENTQINDIIKDSSLVNEINEGEDAILVFEKTPFYAESGGQVGDRGYIKGNNFEAIVEDVKKSPNGLFMHNIRMTSGTLKKGDKAELLVDKTLRGATQRNHTATHLLHKALKEVVGEHINQAGSLVNENRLRFDFNHFEGVTAEQIKEIEKIVNRVIYEGHRVNVETMSIEEAKQIGAVALFGEKYDSVVRVVSVEGYSTELCGGTHVQNSSDIGMFKILSESGIASGVRRIEAITGENVYKYLLEKEELLTEVKSTLKCNEDMVVPKINQIIDEHKEAIKALSKLKSESAMSRLDDMIKNAQEIKGIKYISDTFENIEDEILRKTAEQIINKVENSVVLFSNIIDAEKVSFVCMVSGLAQAQGVHAGNLIKEVAKITGGGGGGRPNMAQAGGKDSSKVPNAMDESVNILASQIK